jgi:hypothetical protein
MNSAKYGYQALSIYMMFVCLLTNVPMPEKATVASSLECTITVTVLKKSVYTNFIYK